MKFLICVTRSHGDLFPYIAIDREMLARGHEALIDPNPMKQEGVPDPGQPADTPQQESQGVGG
jgi:hypothetical protein